MVRGASSEVAEAKPPATDFTLQTPDDVVIAATFTPGATDHAPAVLLLHGQGQSRQETALNAAWLASLGYATLTIDFRGHGQSELVDRTFGLQEAFDARAAFDWLKRHEDNAPVAVIGISLGGAASLLGAAGPLPAQALILQAVYPDFRDAVRNRMVSRLGSVLGYMLEPLLSFQSVPRFGVWPSRLSPVTALKAYHGPVLVIGGQQDEDTPTDDTLAMYAAAGAQKQLWLVPSGDHAEICALADAEYRTHVRDFLRSVMPAPS